MHYLSKQYAKALYEATQGLDAGKVELVVSRFVSLLARNHDVSKQKTIIEAYEKYRNEQEGIQEIEVTTAHEQGGVSKYFEKKTQVVQTVDRSLIGGVKIRIGDDVWDGSVRKKLELLREGLFR